MISQIDYALVKKIGLFLLFFCLRCAAAEEPADELSYASVQKRLAPDGSVNISGQKSITEKVIVDAATPERSGQEVYNQYCVVCHSTGVAGSPKFGCAQAWAPHRAKELKQKGILLQHALHGFNFMPPKGTCVDCSQGELEEAIHYMLNHSVNNQC